MNPNVFVIAWIGLVCLLVGVWVLSLVLIAAGLLLLFAARRLHRLPPIHTPEVQHPAPEPVRIRVIITNKED